MARVAAFMTMIAWNIFVGTSVMQARTALRSMIEAFKPEVFGLMEATNLYGDLNGLGYEVIQLRPSRLRKRNVAETANIAVMVRKDIPIKGRYVLRMKEFWLGPNLKKPHDPRVYRWVKIKWKGRTWKIGVAHVPFGKEARTETKRSLVKWFASTLPGRPTVLLLDANMSKAELEKALGTKVDAEIDGHRIDLTVYKNCELKSIKNLGKGPSDHPAMKYEFVA